MWSRQNATEETPDGRRLIVSVSRAFTVTLDASDAVEIALSAAGLPGLGSVYDGTNFVFCKKRTPQRVSPIMAIVAVEYSGEIGGTEDAGIGSSPIDNPIKLTWRTAVTDEAIDEDINGLPLVTANNEPIEGLTEKFCDDLLTIERNFLAINRFALAQYRMATNSDIFFGWPPGTARIVDETSSATWNNGVPSFWTVSVTFQFRIPLRTTNDKTWWKRVRHEGFLVRDTASDDPHIAWDEVTKSPVSRPVLLKADGTRETDPDSANWLEFQTLRSLPFSALGLT